jgi:hypothetical protein
VRQSPFTYTVWVLNLSIRPHTEEEEEGPGRAPIVLDVVLSQGSKQAQSIRHTAIYQLD